MEGRVFEYEVVKVNGQRYGKSLLLSELPEWYQEKEDSLWRVKMFTKLPCNCEVSKYCNKDGQWIQKHNAYISERVFERETMMYGLEPTVRSKAEASEHHWMKA